ncbi:MAG: hypothetical protein ACHQX3_00515 [Nitrospirales bacterium]
MIALYRANLKGKSFRLVEVFGQRATSIRTAEDRIIVQHHIRDIAEWWHLWVMGEKIQTAFSCFTPEERQFLQKGGR